MTSGASITRVRRELDALVRPEPEAGVEQPLPVAEDHRCDVQLQLLQEAGLQDLAQQRPPAADGDVLVAGGLPGELDSPLDTVGHERERRAALLRQHLAGPMGHHEHRRPERRVVAPRDLAGVEHAPTHHVGAGGGEGLLDDRAVDRLLAPGEALALPPGHGIDRPSGDPEEPRRLGAVGPAHHALGVPRVPGARVETVQRHRHLRSHLGHLQPPVVSGPNGRTTPESEPTAGSLHASRGFHARAARLR